MTEQQVRELLLRTAKKERSLLPEVMEITEPTQSVVPSQPAGQATGEDGAEAPVGGEAEAPVGDGAEAPVGGGGAEARGGGAAE